MDDKYSILKSRFKHLKEGEWSAFEGILTEVKKEKDNYLLRPGQIANDIYLIKKGGVRSFSIKNGNDITDYFFFENTFVSYFASLYGRTPANSYLQAIEDLELIGFSLHVANSDE